MPPLATPATWCVDAAGRTDCKSTIGAAVSAAAAGDTVLVHSGVYNEDVIITKTLSLISNDGAVIAAGGMPNGIYVNGMMAPGLAGVVVSGFTVRGANFEGILVQNASRITVANNTVIHNNRGLNLESFTCPGIPAWETAEDEDCGEGIHLVATDASLIANNVVQDNAGGILLTDETGPTHDNLITKNVVRNNPYDCGITLAGHPQAGSFGTPLGVYRNTILSNESTRNGFQAPGAGAGVGIFAFMPGANMSGNVAANNVLRNNGLPGVTIHAHSPGEIFENIVITGNRISGNGADTEDASTPGTAGINIFGASAISGLVISENTIRNQDIDVAINTPADVSIRLNNLLGNGTGLQNLGPGTVDAALNWWGCDDGPGGSGCASVGSGVPYTPFLRCPVNQGRPDDDHRNEDSE